MRFLAFKSISLGVLLSALVVSAAWAQKPAPGPDIVNLTPDGEVNVQNLPTSGPRTPVHKDMPFLTPDIAELRDTKDLHNAGTQLAPNASATIAPGSITASSSSSFQGLKRSESGGWVPPDTQIGVGPNHVFEAVNLEGRIWSKTDGTVVSTFNLNSFFNTSAQLSDPKIRYDWNSQRWFIAVISYNNSFTNGAWRLAVSRTSDPTGLYALYTASTSRSAPDFPALGINDDKVVLTANAFRGNNFLGTEFIVINKANLVAGGSAASAYFGPPQGLFTIQPAQSLSTTSALYMASVAYNSATSIRVWAITGVPGSSTVKVTTLGNPAITSLTSPPNAQQSGTNTTIETNDNRLLDAVYQGGNLWVSATSACVPNQPTPDTATRACLRYIQLSVSPTTVSKIQDFDFGKTGFYYYYPAIQTDGAGNLISVFSGSSALAFPGVYASAQPVGATSTFQTPALIHGGENAYTPFANRWGDYSGAALDPSDSTKVWVAGEYVDALGGSEWGTWVAPVQVGP
jgi:hypothetical protein